MNKKRYLNFYLIIFVVLILVLSGGYSSSVYSAQLVNQLQNQHQHQYQHQYKQLNPNPESSKKQKLLQNQSPFQDNYSDCVQQFLNLKDLLIKLNQNVQVLAAPDISFQVLYWPTKGAKKTLVIQSGLHGIEGFVGSAIQYDFAKKLIDNFEVSPLKVNLLFIHGINSWGFANIRRVNENNVDLNRNFPIPITEKSKDNLKDDLKDDLKGELKDNLNDNRNDNLKDHSNYIKNLYNTDNVGYQKLNTFLNPPLEFKDSRFHYFTFVFQAIKLIIFNGMKSLKQSVLQGQYQYSKGIFYGGQEPQIVNTVELVLNKFLDSQSEIVFVDLHTGYGTRGQLHLLLDANTDGELPFFQNIFNPEKIELTSDKNFYQVKGGYLAYLKNRFKSKNIKFNGITFEFGTLNSNTTFGTLKSLYNMVIENQTYFYGASPQDQQFVHQKFREHFYPSDPDWRAKTLEQGNNSLFKVLTKM